MRRFFTLIFAITFLCNTAFAQNTPTHTTNTLNKSRTEIMTNLAALPDVSVTYLTKSMLQRLPKDKSESPLAMLVKEGGVESIRLFQLGNTKAEAEGKRLMDSYLSDISGLNYAELLMLQNNASNEVIIYGFLINNDTSYYHMVLMYSKAVGKKAILIIIKGKIHENTIGDLIDSFSK